MTIGTRYYLLEEGGALKRVALRVVDGLAIGADALPAYAGTRQRVVQVLVEIEDRRPARILDVTGTYWDFDSKGRIDASLRQTTGEWLDFAFSVDARPKPRGGRVVDLVPELKRKALHARHRWTISQEDLDRIAADLRSGAAGPVPALEAVRGRAPRRPPLTEAGRLALDRIGTEAGAIDAELAALTEPALRGLAFEADRHAFHEAEALWRGIAEHARHRRAILAAHRTGRGTWYAVVEAHWRDRAVAEAYAKGRNREEAATAGRALLVEKAEWFGPGVRVVARLCSALEWSPEED